MKLLFLLIGLLFIVPRAEAQTIAQTWIDPCTGAVQTATFNLNGPGVTIVYRNQIRTFTAQQAINGELMAWINQVTVYVPCPITSNPVVNQTATQTATQSASTAASSAASSAAGSAASSSASSGATSGATSGGTSGGTTGGDGGTTSSSSETTTTSSSGEDTGGGGGAAEETSTEADADAGGDEGGDEGGDAESDSEEESDSSDENKSNPVIVASDLTFGQNLDGSFTSIFTTGISQSSLMGDKSYGGTLAVWTTLNQFALSGNYTKLNLKSGKLNSISSYTATTAYLDGNILTMAGYTWVKPTQKYGIVGVSSSALIFSLNGPDGFVNTYGTSVVGFYMPPSIEYSQRLSFSPQLFVINSPVSYNTLIGLTTSTTANAMVGSSIQYSITRRFGVMGAYRVALSPTNRPLHYLMIGNSVTF